MKRMGRAARQGLAWVAMVALGIGATQVAEANSLKKAVRTQDVKQVRALVKGGEEPQDVLAIAAWFGDIEMANVAVDELGASVNPSGGRCPMINAAMRNHLDFVRWFLDRGGPVDCRNVHGRTALYFVADRKEDKFRPMVQLLLEHGANPWNRDNWKRTPVGAATTMKRHEFVTMMKEHDQRRKQEAAARKAAAARAAQAAKEGPAQGKAPAPAPAAPASKVATAPPRASRLPDIDEPLKTGARATTDAAVVVGIEDYFVLPGVPYARRDADAFYRFLVFTRGVPASRVKLLNKGASREALLDAVEEVGKLGSAEGTVWVYFAGHGAASPETGERLLLGDDARPDLRTFESRAVTVAEVRERAGAGGARVAMILDTCYTGAGRDGAELIAGKRFAVPAYVEAQEADVLEWTAASPGEWSGPLEPARHGAFTYLTLGALRGWADGYLTGQPDGTVTAEEARMYVQDGLRALQIDDQTPVLAGADVDDWVLSSGALEEAPTLDATLLGD